MTNKVMPVVVDLDGTLTRSDLLIEAFLVLIKSNIFYLFRIIFWLSKGKAHLKAEIAKRAPVPVEMLPYNEALLAYLHNRKAEGHPIYLATASNIRQAEAIQAHLGLFDGVFASDDDTNLSGHRKRERLNEAFGKGEYIYAGNHKVDLEVWQDSAAAVVVGGRRLAEQAGQLTRIDHHVVEKAPGVMTYFKAFRVHQWVKNLLVLVPLLTSHALWNDGALVASVLGFLAFSFCASSVYLLNDLLDLNDDRGHDSKRFRPLAAGAMPLVQGVVAAPVLLLLALVLCTFLPIDFFVVLVCYYIITVAYSFKLKRLVLVDVITLASLYTIRILAGAAVIGVTLSFWLLSFSMFIFLSLAIVKRYTELMRLRMSNSAKTSARGYEVEDLELLSSLGGSAGYLSVLVFALYINSPEIDSLYAHPELMWPACLVLLYWVSRLWIIAHRGNMNDDPIVFALKDLPSLLCGAMIAIFMGLAL